MEQTSSTSDLLGGTATGAVMATLGEFNSDHRERSSMESIIRGAIGCSGPAGAAIEGIAELSEATGHAYRDDTERGIELADEWVKEGKMTEDQARDYVFDRAVHKLPGDD